MHTSYEITKITTDQEIQQCWEVVFLLRPHLAQEKWPVMVSEMMRTEKFNITGISDECKFVAFVGYRFMTSLHSGHIIYVDDLCTLESYRGKGLASKLLEYVKALAVSDQLDAVVLDTNFNNHPGQKLYLKHGFHLSALHLTNDLRR